MFKIFPDAFSDLICGQETNQNSIRTFLKVVGQSDEVKVIVVVKGVEIEYK